MQTDWTGTETFSRSGSALHLTEALSVEWQPSIGTPPVQADFLRRPDQTVLRITTSPGDGWVRMHLKVEAESKPVLGASFVIAASGAGGGATLKPFIAVTNLQNDRRKDVPAAPGARMQLENGQWYDLSGAFLCKPMGEKFRADFVVDLPRDARVFLARCAFDWFEGDLSAEARKDIADKEVLPVSDFKLQPVPDLTNHLKAPSIYAKSFELHAQRLTGWALTPAGKLYWSEFFSGRNGACQLDEPAQIGAGLSAVAGCRLAFEPPLGEGALVQVRHAEGSAAPVWMHGVGTSEIDGTPVSRFLNIRRCGLDNHELFVEGDAVHPLYPGMPVRLELRCGARAIASTLASAPAEGSALPDGKAAFRFGFRAPLRPSQSRFPCAVAFTGLDRPAASYFWPVQRVEKSIAAMPGREPPRMPAGATVLGRVENFGGSEITGWAVCVEESDAPVDLLLKLNDRPFAHTKTRFYRKEVQDRHGGLGYCGFKFELPPNMSPVEPARLSVVPLGATNAFRNGGFRTPDPVGEAETAILPAPRSVEMRGTADPGSGLSVIVLNRNGAGPLDAMFRSCAAEDLSEAEWIVVDHDSDDASERVCRDHAEAGANIRFHRRQGNYSFSESNNFGVRQATGGILVFANNDLVFGEAFGGRVRSYLSAANVGVLGARLVDHVDAPAQRDLRIDQHLGVFLKAETTPDGFLRPFEARSTAETTAEERATRCIAVTGAFLAMRRPDFEAAGGFDEHYAYGLEDVDLCLTVRRALGLEVICANDIEIAHHRGYSRHRAKDTGPRNRRNNEVFSSRWGARLRRMAKETGLTDPALVSGSRPVVAFLVADTGEGASSDERLVAVELGRALQKQLACHVRYIPESGWYDLAGVDVAIAVAESFDIRSIKTASPWLTTAKWVRGWFDRCAADPACAAFDHLFATSETAAAYLENELGRRVHALPAAAAYRAFAQAEPKEEWACDYCFAGDRSGLPREIEFQLDPDRIRGIGRVFGGGWTGTALEAISDGPIDAALLPRAYASARVVLDDAPLATRPWGGCRTHVFDAMASGALLISNDVRGCRELFGDLVPTFSDADSLTEVLNRWLDNEAERKARAAEMQKVIREKHSYDCRARSLVQVLGSGPPVRIAIKCAAAQQYREQWGDYHFACGLADALRRLGYVARVDCREEWYGGICESDDLAIVLRGRVEYRPSPHQKSFLWMISHPDKVTVEEIDAYNRTFVASAHHAEILNRLVPGKIELLPQCSDVRRFRFDEAELAARSGRNLYVANSRGVLRDPVRWAMSHELALDIYGAGWDAFIDDGRLKGGVISNSVLGGLYAASRLVVCDHWDHMRDMGYVSNRVFDVLGSGGRLAVDAVRGLDSLVPERYFDRFRNEQEFVDILTGPDVFDPDLRREAADWVARHHSFDARAAVFAKHVQGLFELPG